MIPMNYTVESTLRNLKAESKEEYVFVDPRTRKRMHSLKTAFGALIEEAKIENFWFHCLRHTFATRLVARGIDIVTVRDLMGHRDIKMTLRYAHPTPENKVRAVESLMEANPTVGNKPLVGSSTAVREVGVS